MKLRYRPRSFFVLIITGFILVVVPLLTALFSSVKILDGLVRHSSHIIYSSSARTDVVRSFTDSLIEQERKARLYAVLGDEALLTEVNGLYHDMKEFFSLVASSPDYEKLRDVVEKIKAVEEHIVGGMNYKFSDPDLKKEAFARLLDKYGDIASLSKELLSENSRIIKAEVSRLQDKVTVETNRLIWRIFGLIAFSLLFVIVFIFLLYKPIRQIDQGIANLGSGDFVTPVTVSGPRDLEALGEKLDWLRKRLAELDREKMKMVAHISHELKTPLASIKEGAGLLRDNVLGSLNKKQEEVVAILDNNSDKLQVLIQNILDFNMSQASRCRERHVSLRLDHLVHKVVEDHGNILLARAVKVRMSLEEAFVRGDRKQLITVFDNLFSNAVKFTPDNGVIKMKMVRSGSNVVFRILDSGPGISQEDKSHIFAPFFQGKKAETAVVKGSGLGLAIAKEYVYNHGGRLRLLETKQGACFEVVLPLEDKKR